MHLVVTLLSSLNPIQFKWELSSYWLVRALLAKRHSIGSSTLSPIIMEEKQRDETLDRPVARPPLGLAIKL
jgi:hypothetical protein